MAARHRTVPVAPATVATAAAAALLACVAHGSLPAAGDAGTVYNPGVLAPAFCVPVMAADTGTTTATGAAGQRRSGTSQAQQQAAATVCHDPGSASSNVTLPLILFVIDPEDLFTANMLASSDSVDAFLSDYAATTTAGTVLFAARADAAMAAAAAATVGSRLALQPASVRAALAGRLMFASVAVADAPVLAELASQFPAAVNSVSVAVPPQGDGGGAPALFNASRLDCRYTACPWPDETAEVELVAVLGGGAGGCANVTTAPAKGKWVVAAVDGSCTYAAAAAAAAKAGATGLLAVAPPGPVPETGAAPIAVSAVAHNDGVAILAEVARANGGVANATLFARTAPALLLAVDGEGRLAEVGWPKYSTLQMLSWQAAYFNYENELRRNLSRPALVVPVVKGAWIGAPSATATVQLPPLQLLSTFAHMDIDFALGCPGSRDADCPIWDHCITLTCTCHGDGGGGSGGPLGEAGGTVDELARWVTPFRRRTGRWLTPATQLMPRLNTTNCTFALTSPASGWIADLSLRFTEPAAGSAAGAAWRPPPFAMAPLFTGGTFNGQYNNRTALTVPVPPGTKRVEVEAIISGHGSDTHGCCEFAPTTHVFTVNGQAFSVGFGVAGSPMGCAAQARFGSVPNEHGTWYYGRDGWCDGQDVRPHVWDVTAAVLGAPTADVSYRGFFNVSTTPPADGGGEILLSSNLVFYQS